MIFAAKNYFCESGTLIRSHMAVTMKLGPPWVPEEQSEGRFLCTRWWCSRWWFSLLVLHATGQVMWFKSKKKQVKCMEVDTQKHPLHQKAFTPETFYTRHLWHQTPFTPVVSAVFPWQYACKLLRVSKPSFFIVGIFMFSRGTTLPVILQSIDNFHFILRHTI